MDQSLLIKNVRCLVTCDDEDRVLQNVDVFVKDGRIVSITDSGDMSGSGEMPDPSEASEVIDASDMVMYPGLINTHHHLYQTFTRNLPQVQNMELFDWLKTLYEIWKNLDETVVYHSSLTGIADLLRHGCTTILDHHYVFPDHGSGTGDLIGAQFCAADKLGARFYATRGSMDLSKKNGGLPPDSVVQSVDEIMKDSEDAVRRYHDPSPFAMHRVALAPCSPFSVSETLLKETASLARSLKVRMHTHLCETKDEESYMMERCGIRPLEYMRRVGWTGDDVWYAHGIHFNDEELEFLARTGTGVAHCPASNMKLSSGIARIPEMLKIGVKVGLAVDGSASNDGSNLLEEIRTAYLLHRLNSSHGAPSGCAFLKMATRGSASILGWPELGSVEAGKAADFFLVRADRIGLIGAQMDYAAAPATVGIDGSVDITVVNGRVVVRDGKLAGMDEQELAAGANRAFEEFIRKGNIS